MNRLPIELKLKILIRLSPIEIKRYCEAYHASRYLLNDYYLWYLKAKPDLINSYENFINTKLPAYDRYLDLKLAKMNNNINPYWSAQTGYIALKLIFGYHDIREYHVLADDDVEVVNHLLKHNVFINLNEILRFAIFHGHRALTIWSLERGADYFETITYNYYLNNLEMLDSLYKLLLSYMSIDRNEYILCYLIKQLILKESNYIDTIEHFLKLGLTSGDKSVLTIRSLNDIKHTLTNYRSNIWNHRKIHDLLDLHIDYLNNSIA